MIRWLTMIFLFPVTILTAGSDWSQWRGAYDGDGIIEGGALITEWSETSNVIWKTPVPGRGASSPILTGGRVFLTTADDAAGKQFVLCYDQATGRQLWQRLAFEGEFLIPTHRQNTEATPTPVTNGEIVVAMFGINKGKFLVAYDLDGNRLWTTEVAHIDSRFGIGASAVLYKDKIIVLNDMRPTTFVAAPVRRKDLVYFSGGFPEQKTFAFNMKTRSLEWSNRIWTYIVSSVVVGDYLYGSNNMGELACMNADTGEILWREKFKEEALSSPFFAGGYLYFILGNGVTKVIKPDPEKYIEISENSIPGKTFAVPAVVDGLIYYRSGDALYCLGDRKS